ncbi:mitochondrial chaperone bcs1 [Colletotrichum cuscutae]|uniref:Mitochondrial chaperone bcs1 n=1 Tax=Colletotrichum cuscutae TaxID=1209917 RepID=A0AAI9VDJ1_9PEZI|nr:mitochondrial chaperone bcs1 [Colletotrichum cuscutae]
MHPPPPPHLSVMDIFFPGFTGLTITLQHLLNGTMDSYAASKADVYDPDEAYDMLDTWVSSQAFSQDTSSSLVTIESRRGRSMAQLYPDITAKKNLRFIPWGEPLYF